MDIRIGDTITFENSYNKGTGKVLRGGHDTVTLTSGTIFIENITHVNGKQVKNTLTK